MAIHFKTATPKKLLATYKKAIEEGHVDTWSVDSQGDFTHSPPQWAFHAWLRPRVVEKTELVFNIVSPEDVELSAEIYAVYHGRFIESMLAHCDQLFVEASASAMPEDDDFVG